MEFYRNLKIPVSVGELFDKVSILEIKKSRIENQDKLSNINLELEHLGCHLHDGARDDSLFSELMVVNLTLWRVEDKIRSEESRGVFDKSFVDLARSVYYLNDKRSEIKRKINAKFDSHLTEEKEYSSY
jgi:hypothetical protein